MVTPSFGVSRTFDTTLERLWMAFTRGDEMPLWCAPAGSEILRSEMALAVGDGYRFGLALPDGTTIWGAWDIRRVEPPSLLTFVQMFTDDAGRVSRNPLSEDWPLYLRAEFRFALQGGGATVTINLSPLEPTEIEVKAFRAAFAALSKGWERALDALDARLKLFPTGPS